MSKKVMRQALDALKNHWSLKPGSERLDAYKKHEAIITALEAELAHKLGRKPRATTEFANGIRKLYADGMRWSEYKAAMGNRLAISRSTWQRINKEKTE